MMAKPMKTLELHYPMIQFLIILNILYPNNFSWNIPYPGIFFREYPVSRKPLIGPQNSTTSKETREV